MLLGRTIWVRDAGVWRSETHAGDDGVASRSVGRLSELISGAPPERTVVVFEPEGISHQSVETPKANRRAFASLARVRNDHPAVESENLGWGIEYPEPGPGGTFSTLIHSELAPGLVHVQEACARSGCRLSGAWSAYTAAVACATSGSSVRRARFVLIVTDGFAAIASCGGARRSFKVWVGPMLDRDWKAFSALIGDSAERSGPSMAEAGPKRGGIVVIADGEPECICPIWKDIRASGRLEAVVGLEALALGAARIPAAHPANLVEAFPRPRELDRFLMAAGVASLAAAIALGALLIADAGRLRAVEAAAGARVAGLEVRLAALGENRKEMERLTREAPDGTGMLPTGRYDALVGLAAAIPDALTLASLTIAGDGRFVIEALVVGGNFDQEDTRVSLARCGFVASTDKGWVYDAGPRRLLVRGRYGEAKP